MRFFRWLLRWLGFIHDAFIHDAPVAVEPRVFNPFPIVPESKHQKRVPVPGSKVARRIMKARGLPYDGEVFHTGELTEANNERARHRAQARQ